jgi:hypothetical protein
MGDNVDNITVTMTIHELEEIIEFIDSNFDDVIRKDKTVYDMDWIRMMIQLRDNLVKADKEWYKERYR